MIVIVTMELGDGDVDCDVDCDVDVDVDCDVDRNNGARRWW